MQLFPSVLFHYTKLLMYIFTVGQTQLHQRARKTHLDAKIVLMILNKTAKVRLYGHGITFYLRCKGLSLTVRRKQVLLEWLQLRRPNVFTRQLLKTILLSGGSGFALFYQQMVENEFTVVKMDVMPTIKVPECDRHGRSSLIWDPAALGYILVSPPIYVS